jgi:hypothetical protein
VRGGHGLNDPSARQFGRHRHAAPRQKHEEVGGRDAYDLLYLQGITGFRQVDAYEQDDNTVVHTLAPTADAVVCPVCRSSSAIKKGSVEL